MRPTVFIAFALLAMGTPAQESDSNSVLRSLIGNSSLVVSGTVTNTMGWIGNENGIKQTWPFEIDHLVILKGQRHGDSEIIRVSIKRIGYFEDIESPFVKDGQKVILFLQPNLPNASPRWCESDPWFSVQQYSTTLAKRITQIAEETNRITTSRGTIHR